MACASASNGELLWQVRTKGPFSATPIAAGGLIYLFNEKGLAQVVKPGETSGKILSKYGSYHIQVHTKTTLRKT